MIKRRLVSVRRRLRKILLGDAYQEYSVQCYKVDSWQNLNLETLEPLSKIDRYSLKDDDVLFIADPFLFCHEDKIYLFFEVMPKKSKEAYIGCSESIDGTSWTYLGRVNLDQDHFSFPNIFRYGDDLYMIPESPSSRGDIYRCLSFPLVWEKVESLLDHYVADPSIIFLNNVWYLFGSPDMATLELYMSDNLLGPYVKHPMSPLVNGDLETARPAGKVFRQSNRLYRVFQDCSQVYGASVGYAEIVSLSPTNYAEKIVEKVFLSQKKNRGVHQFDQVTLNSGQCLCVIDVWKKKYSKGLAGGYR